MRRGTTPTHTFTLPFDTSLISKLRVLYAQNDEVVLTKTEADCTFEGSVVSLKLTQEDTFLFDDCSCVGVQLRVLTQAGDALASDVYKIYCHILLDDEVIA